jgi:hypothetical protein
VIREVLACELVVEPAERREAGLLVQAAIELVERDA